MPADLIRKQLQRVVASHVFASAARHQRLLSFLVERTLAGEGGQIKEYVLATEVFGRPPTYDPRLDSLVRVEVRRLRTRLEQYYRGPGAGDPIVISIPVGTYVPAFLPGGDEAEPRPAPAAAAPPRRVVRGRAFARWLALPATVVAALWLQPASTAPLGRDAAPAVAVLPFEPYSSNEDHRLLAARFTDAVTAELAMLGQVSVTSRTSAAQYSGQRPSLSGIAEALQVQFVVEGRAVVQDGHLRVVARLVEGAADRKIWVGTYQIAPREADALAARLASEVADAALQHLR